VQFLDGILGRYTDGAHKEGGLLLDDNLNELRELAFGVVVLKPHVSFINGCILQTPTLVLRALPPTWGIKRSTPKGRDLSTRPSLTARICTDGISVVRAPKGVCN
jgi:hypothetical protein